MNETYKKAAYSARAIFCFKAAGNLLGFFRQVLYAFFFGTGVRIEAFFAASTLTNVSTKLFQTGALSNVFLPIFVEMKQKDLKAAWKLTSDLFNLLFILGGMASALLFWLAPHIVPWFVPGFGSNERHLVIFLFRIIIPTLLLDILATLMTTVLHANRQFVSVENASLCGNVLMMFVLLAFARRIGITAVALSLLSASFFQALFLFIAARREGFRIHAGIALKQKELLSLFKSLSPFFGYMALMQLQVWLTTAVLSLLPQGSMAVVRYGSDLFTQLVTLLSIPFSIVVFPDFSELALSRLKHSREQLVWVLRKSLQMLLFLTVPVMILLITFCTPIIQAMYHRGHFDATSVLMTSSAFAIFSAGFFFEGANLIFKKLLFAFKKNFEVVALMTCGQVIYLLFLFMLVRPFGYLGVAATSPLSTALFLGVMGWYTHAKVLDLLPLFKYFSTGLFKTMGAGIVMVFSCLGLKALFESFHLWGASRVTYLFQTATLCLIGSATYVAASWVLNVEELRAAWSVYDMGSFLRRRTKNRGVY